MIHLNITYIVTCDDASEVVQVDHLLGLLEADPDTQNLSVTEDGLTRTFSFLLERDSL